MQKGEEHGTQRKTEIVIIKIERKNYVKEFQPDTQEPERHIKRQARESTPQREMATQNSSIVRQ